MERARPPPWYTKVQMGLHFLSIALVIATIGAASYVAAQGYGFVGNVAMIMVAVIYVLVLDIWEVVALINPAGCQTRLSAVPYAVAELVAALACFSFPELSRAVAHITVPCNMDAPITDCVGYEDLLYRVGRGYSLAILFDWAVACLHSILFVLALIEVVRSRKRTGQLTI